MSDMLKDIESVLFSKEELEAIVARLGAQISRDYEGKNLLLVSILKVSIVFMSELMRQITLPCEIDFMAVSSYGSSTESKGKVKIIKDLDIPLAGYDVLIVEDILDSGVTLFSLMELLSVRNPKSIRICTLFDKPDRRKAAVTADYAGAEVPNAFIVGYGLDYDEKYRNLPFVGILKEEAHPGK